MEMEWKWFFGASVKMPHGDNLTGCLPIPVLQCWYFWDNHTCNSSTKSCHNQMARKVARAFIDSRARLSFTSFSFVYRLVQRANAHWRVTAATKTSKAAAQQQRLRRWQRSDASSKSSKLLLQSSPDCSLFCSQLLLLLRLRWCWQLVVAVVVAVVC